MGRSEQGNSGRRKGPRRDMPRHGKKTPARHRMRRRDLLLVLALVLAALVVATLILAVWLSGRQAPGVAPGSAPPVPGVSADIQPPFTEEPVQDPEEVPPAPVPEIVIPLIEEPEGGWPEMAFTEEEAAAFDAMLAEWAATPQAPLPAGEGESASIEDASAEAPSEGIRVALYFRDLDSGAEYIYNAGEKFDVASLSKAPYAMYLYTLVEQGAASLDETFLIDAASIEGSEENTGRIKNDPDLPREFTLAELIEYLLRHSDTVAQRVLLGRYPAAGYAAFAAGLGLHHPADVRGVTSGVIAAEDAGVYLAALKDYMDNGAYGQELRDHLMNTSYPMIRSAYPVARKYGWDEYAYHDMAVVYAPHPYLLAILTDKSNGNGEDLNQFAAITQTFEQVMAKRWAEAGLGADTKMGVA